MSSEDLQYLRSAYSQMMTIKDNRGYNFLAGIHGVPQWYCWHHQRRRRFNLALRLFLPWHRAYLYMFEQAAKDVVPGVLRYLGGIGDLELLTQRGFRELSVKKPLIGSLSNPLAKAHISVPDANPPADRDTTRFPGDPSELPTSSQVNFALSLSDYGDFSDELEGIHDGIHVWVGGIGGDMASVPFADLGSYLLVTSLYDR